MGHSLPGIGIFGTNYVAIAAGYFLKYCGFRIEAVWGRTDEEAKEVASLLKASFSTSHIDELLLFQHVDLVCIYSPPFLQSEIAGKTLGIGKNVLCQRPAGLNCDDAERMLTAAKYYPALMSLVAYCLRFLPTFCMMKKKIEEGFIGDITVVEIRVHSGVSLNQTYDWSHDSRMGGGILSLFGGHFIDVVSYISGQKAIKVHGYVTTFQKVTQEICGFREITSDDFCTFEMKLDRKAFCTCVINNNVPGAFTYEMHVIGTKASLLAKDGRLYGQCLSNEHSLTCDVFAEDERTIPTALKGVVSEEFLQKIPLPFAMGLLKLIESLKNAFTEANDRRRWDKSALSCAATFEDGLYVQQVMAAIRKSSKNSEWEQL